ncbi:M10 family metallopeptidase C-terminal domain-containing protein [Microvirga sesbaniae]|uniref:M10 family metallopeptidase C-terminal domain-containing protein n=1 Tax=Microvirga sesbaniae TaxID=681392 RepID=UPI0021C95BBE|nr:M10 family metallopeptidase C-terminal domain-containing protein [Microvirga sp. HBU67692]
MPAVTSVNISGDNSIDGLLGELKWAANSFTYSFPTASSYYGTGYGDGETSTNFGALNTMQQSTVRAALSMYASVANLTFTQISETSTRHADLRFAMSDLPNTAWGYFPATSGEGGDAWFNKSSGSYSNPMKGNYAYLTFLHEIGHTLGLEHPHESGMPVDLDSIEYTVMSYASFIGASTGTGYVNETWGFAQSLMMYDISAVQQLYGANYTTNSAATVYSWSATTGEMFIDGIGQGPPGGNRILLTVWDGGGTDTYDFSSYSANLKVDLRPGNWTTTSTTQLAGLRYDGSKLAAGSIANALLYQGDTRSLIENAVGGSGSDTIIGNQAANALSGNAGGDTLTGGQGNDLLDGGSGTDTAVFTGDRSDYAISWHSDGSIEITDLRSGAPDGNDLVSNIEWYRFADRLYELAEFAPSSGDQTLTAIDQTPVDTPSSPVVPDPLVSDPEVTLTRRADPIPVNLTLSGTSSNDKLVGGVGDDTLYGGAGSDVLIGGAGRDYLNGGNGIDSASYANASAAVVANLTSPAANQGEAEGDRFSSVEGLIGSAYADNLVGNSVANTIKGGTGNDGLSGQGGSDVLSGGSGDDILIGGSGRDVLYGGSGADTFVFTSTGQSRGSSIDTIKDFIRRSDHIDLRSIDANAKVAGNQAFSFIGRSEFTGKSGQLKFVNGVVSGDVNGDKVADFQIKVTNLTSLSKGDFYL